MEIATWESCRAEFAVNDGALVDLIVPGTGSREWEAFWTALRSGPFALDAYRDGELIPLPENAAWAFAERALATVTVSITADSVIANCHFFGGDLELDIDPREVISEKAFELVLKLMRFVADAVGLPVFAVPESGRQEHAFLIVSPSAK